MIKQTAARDATPVLSIVVATRNRARYAKACIDSLLTIPDRDVEIVLQDNSDDDTMAQIAAERKADTRLRYNRTDERLDMNANYSRGVELATGKFVTMIGDDDGVNPEIVLATRWAESQNVDALLPTIPAYYRWPDARHWCLGAWVAATLELSPFSGRLLFPDLELNTRWCVRNPRDCYGNLPRLYYGMVRRACLDRLKAKVGHYFPGPSPDLAGAVANVSVVRRMAKIDYPLFLPGFSAASPHHPGQERSNLFGLEDRPHIPQFALENWSELVPRIFTGASISSENIVQALRATGRGELLCEFNLPYVHAMCSIEAPALRPSIENSLLCALAARGEGLLAGRLRFRYYIAKAQGRRVKAAVRRAMTVCRLGKHRVVRNLDSIDLAVSHLVEHLRVRGYSFSDCVAESTAK